MRYLVASVAAAVTCALLLLSAGENRAEDKKPKYTTKQVMKLAHKDGLLKKVVSGKASDDEKKQLAELYVSLSQNNPPKGEMENWKETTANIVKQAKAAAAGDADAPKLLQKAVDCKGCHSLHKG